MAPILFFFFVFHFLFCWNMNCRFDKIGIWISVGQFSISSHKLPLAFTRRHICIGLPINDASLNFERTQLARIHQLWPKYKWMWHNSNDKTTNDYIVFIFQTNKKTTCIELHIKFMRKCIEGARKCQSLCRLICQISLPRLTHSRNSYRLHVL